MEKQFQSHCKREDTQVLGSSLTLWMCHLPPGPICISVHLQPEASKPKVLRSISNYIKRELRGHSIKAWEEPGQGAWLSALLEAGLAWEDGNPDQKGSPWLALGASGIPFHPQSPCSPLPVICLVGSCSPPQSRDKPGSTHPFVKSLVS